MVQLTSQNGHTAYGLKEFVVSTEREIEDLPIEDLLNGSTVFVLETSSVYMFDDTHVNENNEHEYWVKI